MQWQMIVLKFQYYIQLSSSLFLLFFSFSNWFIFHGCGIPLPIWNMPNESVERFFDIDSINNKDGWLELINKIKKNEDEAEKTYWKTY